MLRHVTFLHTSWSVLGIAAVACTAADIKTGNCTGGDSGTRSGGKGQLTDRWRNKAAGGRPPSEAGAFLAHGARVCALRQCRDRPAAGRGSPPARSPSLLLRVRPSVPSPFLSPFLSSDFLARRRFAVRSTVRIKRRSVTREGAGERAAA